MKKIKIEDFISEEELKNMSEKEREIFEKVFLDKKDQLQDLKNISDKLDNLNIELSDWQEEAKWRLENRSWLKKSQQIALKILRHLRENNISKSEFAEKMNTSLEDVNEWVKGSYNFDIKTIYKINEKINEK